MELWINPACSKCRATTAAFDEAGIAYTVRRYLDDPPTAAELTAVLDRLGLEPWDLVRWNEQPAAALRTLPKDPAHRADWLQALVTDPILIHRPILTADDGTATIARTPESLTKYLPT